MSLLLFHLGNGAMLPLYGQAVVGAGKGDAALLTATTVEVAQAVMILAALIAMWMAAGRGYWLVLLISFAALPIRGVLAGSVIEQWGVWPVQALDGVGPDYKAWRCQVSSLDAVMGRRLKSSQVGWLSLRMMVLETRSE